MYSEIYFRNFPSQFENQDASHNKCLNSTTWAMKYNDAFRFGESDVIDPMYDFMYPQFENIFLKQNDQCKSSCASFSHGLMEKGLTQTVLVFLEYV